MKKIIIIGFTVLSHCTFSQNPIPIPDTLTGTTIHLRVHTDSMSFLPGTKTFTNAFNSFSYLGPTLILNKGEFVTMNVENQLGDTTTVHWHGLHVPAASDGGPHTVILPNITWQAPFLVKNNAATYWYHPHLHMRTGQQAMRGAAGIIIVRDSEEATLNLPRRYGIDDFPIIIQTQQFDSSNQILWRGMNDSIVLVNGTQNPQLTLPAQVVRLRLLNASQERNLNLGFTGNTVFSIIASDGGLLQAPATTTRLRLSPGERAEILINLRLFNGQTIHLLSYASELPPGVQGAALMTGMDSTMESPLNGTNFNLLQIDVVAPTTAPVTSIPVSLVSFAPLFETQANETRWITITPLSSSSFSGPFFFNGQTFDLLRIDYTVPLNHIEVWTISNQSMVAHPFHMHDVQFFILDRDGIAPPPEEQGFKDNVLLFPNETVRIIMKFEDYTDPSIPYMYHCHILMHEDDGMMGQFIVSTGTGVEADSDPGTLAIVPNPVEDGALNLRFPIAFRGNKCQLEISDLMGKKIFSNSRFVDTINEQFNLPFLSAGTYFIRAESNGRVLLQKFVKLN
ncbi:MAG TPA: multicopper oxidase domain-containing protein [Bacteroidia bacterium]|nr:multicopper oxidase domain-containing protein [Bacteroidia bacterium]